jgi:hypothetical protein
MVRLILCFVQMFGAVFALTLIPANPIGRRTAFQSDFRKNW